MKTRLMTRHEFCFSGETYAEDKTILNALPLFSQPSCLLNEDLYVLGHKCLSFQKVLLIKSNCARDLNGTQ